MYVIFRWLRCNLATQPYTKYLLTENRFSGVNERRRPSQSSAVQQGILAQGAELPNRARSSSRPQEWARTGVVRATPEVFGSSSPSSQDSMINRPTVLGRRDTLGSGGPGAAILGSRQVPGTQMEVPATQVSVPQPRITAPPLPSPRVVYETSLPMLHSGRNLH